MEKSKVGLSLVSPMIIGLIVFVLFPIVFSFGLSFFKWDGLSEARFVGLDNYSQLISDPLFWKSLKVTMLYAVITLPINIIIGFFLALFLNKDNWINQTLRLGFYIPQLISGVPLLLLWLWMFNTKYGLINRFLNTIGIGGPSWFENEVYALIAIIIINIWGVGNYMLIFLATFQRIPTQLIEVIKLEGGTFKQVFKYAIFPYISPIVFFLVVVGFIGSTQVFSEAYVITQGGPNNATLFYAFYVYQNAFSFFKMGYASALAWVFFLILMVFTGMQFFISKFWVNYDEVKIM